MSFGSNSGSGTTVQEIPPWLQETYQRNVARAEGVANTPFQAYGGQLTAGDNADLSDARFLARQGVTSGMDATQAATNNLTYLGQQTPSWFVHPGQQSAQQVGDIIDVTPALSGVARANGSTVAGSDLSRYTNPYEDQVVQGALRDVNLQRDRQANADNAATPSGAFGGSRQGVADALRNERFDQQALDTAAGLRSAGYGQAMGFAGADADRQNQISLFNANAELGVAGQNADRMNSAQQFNSQADYTARLNDAQLRQQAEGANADRLQAAATSNQNYALSQTGQRLAANQALLGAGRQQQDMAFAGANALGAAGQQLQGTQQAGLDAQYSEFQRMLNDPVLKQQLLNQSTLGINAGGTTTTNSKGKGFSL